jgi:hypothetical protein
VINMSLLQSRSQKKIRQPLKRKVDAKFHIIMASALMVLALTTIGESASSPTNNLIAATTRGVGSRDNPHLQPMS